MTVQNSPRRGFLSSLLDVSSWLSLQRWDGELGTDLHPPTSPVPQFKPAPQLMKPPSHPGLVQTFYFPSAHMAQPAWGWVCLLEAKPRGLWSPSPPSSQSCMVALWGPGEPPWPGQHHRLH